LSVVACLYFTASVAVDWMPSLRHLLPVTAIAPIGWACLVAELEARRRRTAGAVSREGGYVVAAVVLLVVVGAQLLSVDVRLSPIEHTREWVKRKSREKWSDTV